MQTQPTGHPSTPPRRPRSRWTVPVVAVALAATASPVAWLATRPAPDAGVPIEQALGGAEPPPPAPDQTPPPEPAQRPSPEPAQPPDGAPPVEVAPERPYGAVGVRDASLESLAAEPDPTPTRLRVDALGVDAGVEAVGVQDDGSMVVPAEVGRVGWYRHGPVAGATQGHTVIAGHVDGAGKGPGALFELREVEVGTRITVTDEAGDDHVYEVAGRETITKDVLPVDDIFAREGEHRLVVITCGGPFQPELGSYRDNVVVTAVPVGPA